VKAVRTALFVVTTLVLLAGCRSDEQPVQPTRPHDIPTQPWPPDPRAPGTPPQPRVPPKPEPLPPEGVAVEGEVPLVPSPYEQADGGTEGRTLRPDGG
jgi:hypothetical protein